MLMHYLSFLSDGITDAEQDYLPPPGILPHSQDCSQEHYDETFEASIKSIKIIKDPNLPFFLNVLISRTVRLTCTWTYAFLF